MGRNEAKPLRHGANFRSGWAPFRQPRMVVLDDGWAQVWERNGDNYGSEAMNPSLYLIDEPLPAIPDWAAAPSIIEAFIRNWGFVPTYPAYSARFKKGPTNA